MVGGSIPVFDTEVWSPGRFSPRLEDSGGRDVEGLRRETDRVVDRDGSRTEYGPPGVNGGFRGSESESSGRGDVRTFIVVPAVSE